MQQATKSDRTKQVQFRMPTVLHNQLRKLLIDDNVSMADLFNKAAEEYINKRKKKDESNDKTWYDRENR